MGDRAVDCARLESVCAERHRGFESPPIRVASDSSRRKHELQNVRRIIPAQAQRLRVTLQTDR